MNRGKEILIRGGTVLTMDPVLGDLADCDVLVRNGRIAAIGRSLDAGTAEVLDAHGCIVLPGLVDGHRHVWQTQLRGVATDWTIVDYMVRMRTLYCVCYEPEDAYLGNFVGGLEAVSSGVTSLVDHSHLQISPEYSDALAQGLLDSGVGGFFCYGFYNNPPYKPRGAIDVQAIRERVFAPVEDWHVGNAARVRDRYFCGSGVLRFGIATSEVFMIPFELARRELGAAWSLEPGLVTAHWACTARADRTATMIPELHRSGSLRKNMLLTHCNNFTPDDFQIVADLGAGICVTPDTELGMGMGFPVQEKVLAVGGRAVFGADICSNVAGDLFGQMRLALQSQRWREFELDERLPTAMTIRARRYLEIATRVGAEAIGMGDEIGTLTPGKRADIIVVRTDSISTSPSNDAVGTLVFYANSADVDTVLINGEVRKRHGLLVNVDWPAVRKRLVGSRDRIMDRLSSIPFEKVSSVWREALTA